MSCWLWVQLFFFCVEILAHGPEPFLWTLYWLYILLYFCILTFCPLLVVWNYGFLKWSHVCVIWVEEELVVLRVCIIFCSFNCSLSCTTHSDLMRFYKCILLYHFIIKICNKHAKSTKTFRLILLDRWHLTNRKFCHDWPEIPTSKCFNLRECYRLWRITTIRENQI